MRNRILIALVVIAVAAFAGYRMMGSSAGEGLRMTPEAQAEIASLGNEVTLAPEVLSSG
jgi:hypothetical protein